jgi:hypothetical protein
LEKEAGNRTSYWAMFTGQGSGDLHTGRRVQLVIWLQIMQEWVGIAGVTICEFMNLQLLLVSLTDFPRCSNDLPYCRIWYTEESMDQWPKQYLLYVLNSHLRIHT